MNTGTFNKYRKELNIMNREGVSVCITAYKAKDYIKECLDSVVGQTWFKNNDEFEIIVGIDGCQETLEYMKTIMNNYKNLRVLMMDSNKGTYITSNTIMSIAKYENIFRFDSDDIMCSNLIETVMQNRGSSVFIRYRFQDFACEKKGVGWAHGTIYIKKPVFMRYGGFRPWPCSADTELYYRLKNIVGVKNLNQILMMRRVHDASLTHNKKTGMQSDIRKRYKKIISDMRIYKHTDAVIVMKTNTFREISVDRNNNADEYMKSLEEVKTIQKEPEVKPVQRKVNPIVKLREDIQAGRVVKVPTTNGFVWRRVK